MSGINPTESIESIESIDPSHISLEQETYENYITQAYELTKGGVDFNKVDTFLDRSIEISDKVEKPASVEAIYLRVSEVFGFVATEALTTSPENYSKIKDRLQNYTDEQKHFLRESVFYSQLSLAKKDWQEQNTTKNSSATPSISDVWLITTLS